MVDVLAMEVSHLGSGEFLKLLHGSDADDLFAVLGDPERDGVSPEAVSGEAPVLGVLEPVVKLLLLDDLGDPVGLVIVLDEVLLDLGDPDEPGRHRLVDEGSVAAPAEGVVVLEHVLADESPAFLQVLHDDLVGVLDVESLVGGHFLGEPAVLVEGDGRTVRRDDLLLDAELVIVLSEAGSAVHDSSTVGVSDEGGCLHSEAAVLLAVGEEVEDGHVLDSSELAALHLLEHLELLLAEVVLESALREDEHLVALQVFHLHVDEVGVDGQGEVGRERPGCGGPGEELDVGVGLEREGYVDGGVGDLLVVLLHLEVGEDGVAGVGVGHDASAAVDKPPLEEHLEDVPHRLHEAEVHGLVIVPEVDPPAEAVDDGLPLAGVPHDDVPALLVVLLDAHLEHLLLVGDLQLLVDLVLDGETVAVPPEPALDVVSSLGGPAADHILDGSRCDVTVVGSPGCEGRPIVESIRFEAFSLCELLLEGVDFVPILECGFLLFREVKPLRSYFTYILLDLNSVLLNIYIKSNYC